MGDVAICAGCGKERELCNSSRVDGIKQPRVCKECLLDSMRTNDWETNDLYWFQQIRQLNDLESLTALGIL